MSSRPRALRPRALRPRALVTGAGIRLGRAMAVALAQDGFDLVLHYRSSESAVQVTAKMCAAHGAKAQVVQADLGLVEGCTALASAAGAVDLLVNSAALYKAVPIEDITPQQWEQMLAVNTRAPFLLTQALLPGLRACKRPGGGCVVMLGDIGGQRPTPGFTHYSVSKAGLLMLTQALAMELAPAVRVNAINPGTVLAPEDLSDQVLTQIQDSIPAKRFGSPDDIVGALRYLVSAQYVTGQSINVDGGRSVGGPMEAG
ncbi:MAG: pteridine reductase [Cognaticolwellia sp.]|jgi:pteridine reductase